MLIRKRPGSIVQTQPLPNAIAQHETRIIDAHERLSFGNDFAV